MRPKPMEVHRSAPGLEFIVKDVAGYLYRAPAFYTFWPFASVSLSSAVLFVVLSAGVLCLYPHGDILSPIAGRRAGGIMARRLLLATFTVPFAVGWVRLKGEEAGFYGTAFGLAAFVCTNVVSYAALAWWMARSLNRLDEERAVSDAAAHDVLAEGERRYRTLAESLPQLVWTCSPDGQCDYLSPQWTAYTGIPEADQLGSRWGAQVFQDDWSSLAAEWARSVQSGEMLDVEFRLRRSDGIYRWFRTRALPVRDQAGHIIKWFGTNTDVDDHNRTEDELRSLTATLERRVYERTLELQAAKEKAESADRLKTDFIMSMSHELRTPLNSIIGFTGTLLMGVSGPLTPPQAQQLGIIQANGRRLLVIISDVLDVARIESGSMPLVSEPVDVVELVRGVASQISPLAEEKQLRIVVDMPPLPVRMYTDRRALQQILLNLARNAVKFTSRGTITLALAAAESVAMRRVEVSVSDTGVGIAPEDRSKLFTKFGRLGNASGDDASGTGLGLCLTRTLVEQLGGKIEVDSAIGQGSRFCVAFEHESD